MSAAEEGNAGTQSCNARVATLHARVMGTYTLHVVLAATGQVATSVPIEVAAGLASVQTTTCAVEGFDGTRPGAVVAGQPLRIVLRPMDRFGNAAHVAAGDVQAAVHAAQGCKVDLDVEQVWGDRWWATTMCGHHQLQDGSTLLLTGTLTKAGSYKIHAALRTNGEWHPVQLDELRGTVVVTPAPLSNAHTALSEVPATLVAGVPSLLYIQPTDRFGNGGAPGGAFMVQLYDGKEAVQCGVTMGVTKDAPLVAKVCVGVSVVVVHIDTGAVHAHWLVQVAGHRRKGRGQGAGARLGRVCGAGRGGRHAQLPHWALAAVGGGGWHPSRLCYPGMLVMLLL